MKINEESGNNIQNTITLKSVSVITEINAVTKVGRQMRKIFFIASIAGIGLSINACTSTGYVETEPSYVEYNRPPQPSTIYIWRNGDWKYNQQNRVYVQKSGYWEKPSHRRTHVAGHWESNTRGSYWVPSYYERNRR
jgi:hypothetical protein